MKSKLELFQLEFILSLVEQQDAVHMLNQEKLVAAFNELFKYELVELADAKILLTQKGKKAQAMGLEDYFKKHHANSSLLEPSLSEKSSKGD